MFIFEQKVQVIVDSVRCKPKTKQGDDYVLRDVIWTFHDLKNLQEIPLWKYI